jgi:hypothetical protein
MKKELLTGCAILVFTAAGCSEKPKKMPSATSPGTTSHQLPAGATPGGDPHAAMKSQQLPTPAGPMRSGTVMSTMNAAGYTYVEVEEKGQKVWVAAMEKKVAVGDRVEFSDVPPMANFTSKTLNRTFDKIIFATQLFVKGK